MSLPIGGEAKGLAGVFGTSINPLSTYMSYSAQRQRNRVALEAQQRAERDKAMDYLDKFNPTSKFNELNYRVADRVKANVRDWYVGNVQAGNSGTLLKNELQNRQAQELAYVEETNAWKEQIDGLEKEIKADPIRYKTGENSALSAVRDIYKNPDGTLRSDDEIRQSLLNVDALKFDPRILNTEGVVKSFVEKLPEQNKVLLSKAYSAMGYSPDEIETMVKSGLTYEMEKNPATGQMQVAFNDDLTPKVVVDDKLYRMAKADPYMNSLMMDASANKEGQMDWLRKNVRGQGDKVSIDRQVISGKRLIDDSESGGVDAGSSIVGSGDNSLKSYDKIGPDKKIGFDSISFGYSSPTAIPFSTTQGGAPDKTGAFSGLRTNPSTGKKEMEFVVPKQFSPGEKEIKYIPYDEKTFQQVLNSLTPKKREELRKLKSDFETQYAKMGEYVLDEDKLNADVDEITKYYEQNKADVGSDKFNSGFSELINKLGLDKNAKSNKTFWWFNPNELTIGDQVVKVTDKENMKQVLYNFQKGKYKKAKGLSGKSEADELGLN